LKKSTILILVLLVAIAAGVFIFMKGGVGGGGSAPSSSVSIQGGEGGTQEIDAGQQTGGAAIEGDVGTVVVEDNALVNSECNHPAQKNFGLLDRNGYHGPMCKKKLARRIKAKNCTKKGGFQQGPVCVMEWEGTQWRVRVLK